MQSQTIAAMRQSVIDGTAEIAADLAKTAIQDGTPPLEIIDTGYVPAMEFVGEQFAQHKIFLPDMLACAEAMKAAMNVLEPELKRQGTERAAAGTVVLGTTKGDIHEIGKALVGTLLTAHGYRVYDLGVDVSAEQFANKVREYRPDVVGVSALLTTTMRGQKTVIENLVLEGLRDQVKVIVGGAPVTRQWAEEIGADGYGKDAVAAVALVQKLLQREAVAK
ncbi:MAG TPA: corrinoid protein [Terriglobales bacterium]|jgi:corrinoid protein of di/trimethylamine methyltransferase